MENIHIDENGIDLSTAKLLFCGSLGYNIPKMFSEKYGNFIMNNGYLTDLEDKDGEFYFESWQAVLNNTIINIDDQLYTLYQDGIINLWGLPVDSSYIYDKIVGLLDKKYSLNHFDYNDNVDRKILGKCITENDSQQFFEYYDERITDNTEYGIDFHIENLTESVSKSFDIDLDNAKELIEEYSDKLREEIESRNDSKPYNDLLRNASDIPIVLKVQSNYETIPSNFGMVSGNGYYYDEYLKTIIDILYLNPALVKKSFIEYGLPVCGKWPNYKHREGKECVKYSELVTELLNNTSYCHLVFLGNFDSMYILELDQSKEIIITFPKGNKVGLFSSYVGGGSILEIELVKDFTVNLSKNHGKSQYDSFKLLGDSYMQHSIKEVYGLSDSYFGDTVKIELK